MANRMSLQHDGGLGTDTLALPAPASDARRPNDVRRLRGMCFVIGSGKAQKIQIAPAPRAPEGNLACWTPAKQSEPPEADPPDTPGFSYE